MGGRHCLPEHLRDKRHNDWLWPFSYIPRAWNAFCGIGPGIWTVCLTNPTTEEKDLYPFPHSIPKPGNSLTVYKDDDGSWRPYYATTFRLRNFWDGRYLHFRIGFRWDNVDHYYNLVVPFNLSWEGPESWKPQERRD